MRSLLCLVGIHRTEWTPIVPQATDPAWMRGWLQVRRCRDCGHTVGRQHR